MIPHAGSGLEARLLLEIRALNLPAPEREVTLVPGRRFRCDFVWRRPNLVVEVEGGLYRGGRHTAIAGFIRDAEKYNLLALAGWRVLRITEKHLTSGQAIRWIQQALDQGGGTHAR